VEWSEGAAFPFLGDPLTLRFAGGRPGVERVGDELRVSARAYDAETVKRAVVRWYKRVAHEHLAARTTTLAHAAGLAPPRVFISPALARWGSCNSRREVRLAWRLVKARPDLVDYVICHELAHLRHMNHSNTFWAEVARQCPDYKRLRDELYATDHIYRSF
jgi:predicted metal-dependent hydrolase